MNKLIKISDYYYVIDDEAETKENDFLQFTALKDNSPFICKWINNADLCKEYNHGVVIKSHFDILGEKGNKVIATTNPNILLPQITNPTDELVGKEVEVGFVDTQKILWETDNGYDIPDTEIITKCIIKPISETCDKCQHSGISKGIQPYLYCNHPLVINSDVDLLDENNHLCTTTNSLFEPKETSTNETLDNRKDTCEFCHKEFPITETHLVGYEDAPQTSCFNCYPEDNKTLEEVAENTLKELFNFEKYKGNNPIEEIYYELTLDYNDAIELFKAGYKHAESKMYSEDEVKMLICKFDNYNSKSPMTFKEFQNWFNNNKK